MASVDDEDEFRDAEDGSCTAPPPSSSPASTPTKSKPVAAAGGFGRRLLASIGLPTAFSATNGQPSSPSSPKPPAPQPAAVPSLGLGLGLLLHHGLDPCSDGSLFSDASARTLHLPLPTDLQKRHEEGEVLEEQGVAAQLVRQHRGGQDLMIGHDVDVGEELVVLASIEEEGRKKEDVADGCSGSRNGSSVQDLDREGEQCRSDDLGAAMEDQEVMEQEGATTYYPAVEDQCNNDAELCTGDAPTAIKCDSVVEEKKAMEQGCAVGIVGETEAGIAWELQEDGLVEGQGGDVISVQDQHKMVEQCTNDELGVAMGDNWVDQEGLMVEQDGVTEYFDDAVEDQSNNAALEQHTSDELRVIKDGSLVEEEKAVEQEAAIGILGPAEIGIDVGLRAEDVVVEGQGEDGIPVQDQDKVVEHCMIDELRVAMGDSTVHDQEVVVGEQEGLVESFDAATEDQSNYADVAMGDSTVHDQEVVVGEKEELVESFDAAMEDQSNYANVEQCTSSELREVKDGNIVEIKEKVLEQEGVFGILSAAGNSVVVGLQEEDNMVVEGQAEDGISVQDQHKVVEQYTSDNLGVVTAGSMVQDREVVVLEQEGITKCFDAVEDQTDSSDVEQGASDELEVVKDGNFVEEKEKAVVGEGAIDILDSTKDDITVGSQEGEVVAEHGEDLVSSQDQHKVVEQCASDQVRATTYVNVVQDQEVMEQEGAIFVRVPNVIAMDAQEKEVEQYAIDESRATKDAEDKEKVVDQEGLSDKQDAIKDGCAMSPEEGDVVVKEHGEDCISVRDQDKVVEQCTSDQWRTRTTTDDNAAEDKEVRREKIRLFVGYPQRPGRQNCRAYMSTGSCTYGLSCQLNHPQVKEKPDVPSFPSEQGNNEFAEILQLNRIGLPIREKTRNCTYYMRNGTCRYGKRCCFNHPEHVLGVQRYKPTGWDNTDLPSSPHLKKSSEHATLDDISSSSEILPPNILRMLLPPQTVPPGAEEKEIKVKKDPEWSSTSDDSDGCSSANSSGGPLCKQEHHVDYSERPSRKECPFLLRFGNCKFASSCHYYHPEDKYASRYHRKDPSPAELMVYPDRPDAPECPFYMKTGACRFGAECKFDHPKDLPSSMQGPTTPKRSVDAKYHPEAKTPPQDHMDHKQNYPERPGQPECRYYMQFGKCKFLSSCIFHHPKDSLAGQNAHST